MDNEIFDWTPRPRFHLDDELRYKIPAGLLEETVHVLQDYGNRNPPCEGICFWAGTRSSTLIAVRAVIATKADAHPRRISVEHKERFKAVRFINSVGLVQIAQVHSHPGDWIDHSVGDDLGATGRVAGGLSIVVPSYGAQHVGSLTETGIHIFDGSEFHRIADPYIRRHFELTTESDFIFKDFRNE